MTEDWRDKYWQQIFADMFWQEISHLAEKMSLDPEIATLYASHKRMTKAAKLMQAVGCVLGKPSSGPGAKTLAKLLGCSPGTASKIFARLEADAVIWKSDQGYDFSAPIPTGQPVFSAFEPEDVPPAPVLRLADIPDEGREHAAPAEVLVPPTADWRTSFHRL